MKRTVPLARDRLAVDPGVGGGGRKSALTDLAASMLTVQGPVPVHAPLQPPSVQPGSGCATSVTVEPLTKSALHFVPQSIPDGVLVTLPSPVFVTLNV